jgi:hypothetical protein
LRLKFAVTRQKGVGYTHSPTEGAVRMFMMNKRTWATALLLVVAALVVAQEPPGCRSNSSRHGRKHVKAPVAQIHEIKGRLPHRPAINRRKAQEITFDPDQARPVIATVSPLYIPQPAGSGSAITASKGYLYVVVGQKLYKVDETTLKTVQVSTLGRPERVMAADEPVRKKLARGDAAKKKQRVVASRDEESPKRRSSKTD